MLEKLLQKPVHLFDFDGLLVNTEQLHFQAYREMVEDKDETFDVDFLTFASHAHTGSTNLKNYLLSTFDNLKGYKWEDLYAEKQERYIKLVLTGDLDFMPGAKSYVELLLDEKKKMAVVTNSTKALIDAVKERLPGLDAIPVWVTREKYQHAKPAPDAYLAGLKHFSAGAEDAIGYEDSLRGVKSVADAGIEPILICHPGHPQMSDPFLKTIPHFESFISLTEANYSQG